MAENDGPEKWVPEAIAEQEEYIKRDESCLKVLGKAHRYETFRGPTSALPVPGEATWRECVVCSVTQTPADYARKLAAQA